MRYADYLLVGFTGSKAEYVQIKANIFQYMSEQLELELSEEKKLIMHAQNQAKFLGYEIYILKSQALRSNRYGI